MGANGEGSGAEREGSKDKGGGGASGDQVPPCPPPHYSLSRTQLTILLGPSHY